MSHISTIELSIDNLDALRTAGTRCGLRMDPAIMFAWYGDFAGDTPESRALIAAGVDPREYEKCAFTLSRVDAPATSYNIGVVDKGDGTYELRFDSWGNGRHLVDALGGLDARKLKDEYAYAVAENYLLSEGYETSREVQADGSIVCVGVQG